MNVCGMHLFSEPFTGCNVLISSMGVVSISARHKADRPAKLLAVRPAQTFIRPLISRGWLRLWPSRRDRLRTASPRPFGASIVHTKSGEVLLRALNAVDAGV